MATVSQYSLTVNLSNLCEDISASFASLTNNVENGTRTLPAPIPPGSMLRKAVFSIFFRSSPIGCSGSFCPISASRNRRSENVGVIPVIVTELELRAVQRHIFGAHFMERTDYATLEDRPEAFNGLSVDCADNVLTFGVIDKGVWIFLVEMLIANPLVCAEQTL